MRNGRPIWNKKKKQQKNIWKYIYVRKSPILITPLWNFALVLSVLCFDLYCTVSALTGQPLWVVVNHKISIQSLNSVASSKYYLWATDELGALWNQCELAFLRDALLHRVAPLINTFSYCPFQQSTSLLIPWAWLVKQILHQWGLLMPGIYQSLGKKYYL